MLSPPIKLLRVWIRKQSISLLDRRYAKILNIKGELTPRFGVIIELSYLKELGMEEIVGRQILECFLLVGK